MNRSKALLKKIGAASVIAVTLAFGTLPTLAGTLGDTVRGGAKETAFVAGLGSDETPTLQQTIGIYINAALGLLGVILVVLIIYAGFLWMTAQGNEEKVKKAKGIISNAVIGMILIFAAYAITNFVLDAVLSTTGPVE